MNKWWKSHQRRLVQLVNIIENLKTKDRRRLFSDMRSAGNANNLTVDTFFPDFGFTAGDFALGQVLNDHRGQY